MTKLKATTLAVAAALGIGIAGAYAQIERFLTPEQREQMKKQWGPGWMMGD